MGLPYLQVRTEAEDTYTSRSRPAPNTQPRHMKLNSGQKLHRSTKDGRSAPAGSALRPHLSAFPAQLCSISLPASRQAGLVASSPDRAVCCHAARAGGSGSSALDKLAKLDEAPARPADLQRKKVRNIS